MYSMQLLKPTRNSPKRSSQRCNSPIFSRIYLASQIDESVFAPGHHALAVFSLHPPRHTLLLASKHAHALRVCAPLLVVQTQGVLL